MADTDDELRGSRVALDAVGIAGFGHDFQTLEGKDSAVTDLFDSFIVKQGDPFDLIFFLGFVFPIFNKLPNARNRMIAAFSGTFKVIADDLIAKCRSQEEFGGEKSILGMLSKCFVVWRHMGCIQCLISFSQSGGECALNGRAHSSGSNFYLFPPTDPY